MICGNSSYIKIFADNIFFNKYIIYIISVFIIIIIDDLLLSLLFDA